MANPSERARPAGEQAVNAESRSHLRVYRWLGLLLAPAAVALSIMTPSALPETAPPQVVQPGAAIELSAATLQWINAASAKELADELPGIGPLYAERIATHRRLFGSIADARTLIDLGIPARVVQRLPAQVPSAQ
ncbi:MAG: hypothetical protein OXF96_08625 [Chloroflexi bacterium]|nr:hypothetical protein [Chloroflexota bacterium]